MDWNATRESVKGWQTCGLALPVAAMHPMRDAGLPDRLQRFCRAFPTNPPRALRGQAGGGDEAGVVTLPPAPFDPVPLATAGALLAVGLLLAPVIWRSSCVIEVR